MNILRPLIAGLISGVILLWMLWSWISPDLESVYDFHTIAIPEAGQTLYVQVRRWGIGYMHREVRIAAAEIRDTEYDATREYRFFGVEPFFYRVTGDTLLLHLKASLADRPESFPGTVHVVGLQRSEAELQQLRRTHAEHGLAIIE